MKRTGVVNTILEFLRILLCGVIITTTRNNKLDYHGVSPSHVRTDINISTASLRATAAARVLLCPLAFTADADSRPVRPDRLMQAAGIAETQIKWQTSKLNK